MDIFLLKTEEAISIMHKFSNMWNKNDYYWYPLSNCLREDVIALEAKIFESGESVAKFIRILLDHDISKIYEVCEDNKGKIIENIDEYMFWESDDYFWNGEAYWFDDSLKWVVYKSHEGTITFGGEWLINSIKAVWKDWSDYTKWDSKKHSIDESYGKLP